MPQWLTLPIAISSLSFFLALISLILTYWQKRRQDHLSTRNGLSDSIDALIDITIEMSKLPFGIESTTESTNMRRSLSTKRRFVVRHANILTEQIPHLCNDVDYSVIAAAYDSVYDFDRSEVIWLKCIEKSDSSSSRAMNRRGIARFYFGQGRFQDGRRQYELSVDDVSGDSDAARRLRADTFAMWSATELDFGFDEEAKRRWHLAEREAQRIAGKKSREDMLSFINSIIFEEIVVGTTDQSKA